MPALAALDGGHRERDEKLWRGWWVEKEVALRGIERVYG